MIIQNNLSNEFKFLINFLFKDVDINDDEIANLNLERLIQIGSKHLLLPVLFYELEKKKLINSFPLNFTNYLQNIYNLNKQRNKQIKAELITMNSILKKNEIKFVFLKGSAMLLRNYYEDDGVRMIGDIDILVDSKDYSKCIEVFKKENYKPLIKESFINTRHFPRMVNKKKLCAIEVHNKLLSNSKIFIDYKKVFQTIEYCPYPIMDNCHMIQNCIYNYELNDNGYIFCSFNLKSFYDFKILNSVDLNIVDKYMNSFILKFKTLMGNDVSNNLYKIRFIMKLKFKVYRIIDNFFISRYTKTNILFQKLSCFFTNKNYRIYLFSKILKLDGGK